MPDHAADHTRHSRDRLQEDEADKPPVVGHDELLCRIASVLVSKRNLHRTLSAPVLMHATRPGARTHLLIVFVSCGQVEAPSQDADGTQSGPVGPVLGLAVGNLDAVHLLLGIDGMRPRTRRILGSHPLGRRSGGVEEARVSIAAVQGGVGRDSRILGRRKPKGASKHGQELQTRAARSCRCAEHGGVQSRREKKQT